MLIGNLEMVLLACIAGLKKIQVSDYPFDFGYPRISVLYLNLYPNRSSGRVRISSSDFGFGCLDTPPEPLASLVSQGTPNGIAAPILCFPQRPAPLRHGATALL